MSAPSKALQIIERFHQNLDAYRSGHYNETQVRREFIDPFFKLLGWDVENEQGAPEPYKDVIHEDAIKVGGATKAPDYSFRIGGVRKFFVEAKKPSVNLRDDISPAFQLRRYAWSANLPVSILTDFEDFIVYDCRVKPDKRDKAATARTLDYNYTEYADRWDEIGGLFSRDAVLSGSLEQYIETETRKGVARVDAAFLKEIEVWRELLAKNIVVWNPQLSPRELNYAVQMTIDRLIFLRISEDRGIEPYERLKALTDSGQVYTQLCNLFREADERYNSGLFHFRKEKDRPELPDDLTISLTIDDEPLKKIIRSTYFPDSPYEFSVLPIEILGQVYEQFLGQVIRLTPGHHVKVEEKPEVRKAGGVYYTPAYIVDYIVKHTVGKLLEDKTPRQAEKLKILDPACGSGSFLIGAYQYLLDWHRNWYVEHDPKKHKKELYQGLHGDWRLTTAERRRILLNNIYGVDIDSQAVEVTKLSLLLKVLEGESSQTLTVQLRMFHERALPDLGDNIKCGNSLIGPDFYENTQMRILDGEERYRINVFDWKEEFPDIMKAGGFDTVIGNPPYIRIQTMKEWAPIEVEHYKQAYISASKGNYDIYVVFAERGLSLLNTKGRLGFILPHKFFNAQYGEPLRALLAKGRHLAEVVHFGHQQVFEGATTYTCLMLLDKSGCDHVQICKVDDLKEWRLTEKAVEGTIAATSITASDWNFTVGEGQGLLEKLNKIAVKLEDVTSRIFQGIKTSADKIYIVDELEREETRVKVYSREKEAAYWLEPDLLHPLIKGGDSKRYRLSRTNRLILFPYAPQGNGGTELLSEATLKAEYPLTWEYLTENKSYLERRENDAFKDKYWYRYGRNQALDVMPLPKIFTPDIAARASFSLDERGDVFFTGGVSGGYGILVQPEHSREYILGLLNSKLLEWYIRQTATQMRGGYFSYESRFIRNLPIHLVNFSNPTNKARHTQMVSFVERILTLHKQLMIARAAQDKTVIQRQIEATDRQIDRLVYELYELTEEEIKTVEEET